MEQPQRAFYSLIEAAGRWDCAPADIIGWAAAERLEIMAPIGPARCGGETVAGMVIVAATDLMPMFRRCGGGPASGPIRRVREIGTDGWKIVTEPAEGIVVDRADLIIVADEVTRFEKEFGLMKRVDRGGGGSGPAAKYDWDGFYLRLIVRIHEQGLPETQADLVGEMQEWFADGSGNGDMPDESTIRRRLNPVWRALQGRAV